MLVRKYINEGSGMEIISSEFKPELILQNVWIKIRPIIFFCKSPGNKSSTFVKCTAQ